MVLLHNLKNIFHVLIIFQCLFFSIYLFSRRHRTRQSNLLLAVFLLVIAFTELGGVFLHFLDLRGFLIARLPHILYINFPFPFLAAPLLYFYVLSFTRKGYRIKKIHVLHLIPFVVSSVLIILRYHAHSAAVLREMLKGASIFSPAENLAYDLTGLGQFLAYVVASFAVVRSYRAGLKNVYSTVEQLNLSWLTFVLTGFVVVRILEVAEYALWVMTGVTTVIILYYAAQVVFIVFLALMFFKGLRQPEVFGEAEFNHLRGKYEKTLLSEEQKEKYRERLISYMESQKPYLNPLLTLNRLAQRVSIPGYHLSQVINACFSQNFFDYVNSYRVRESQRMLADKTNGKRTILEILLESGFNSKSVFNTAFKKHTGLTPSQFRKRQGSENLPPRGQMPRSS